MTQSKDNILTGGFHYYRSKEQIRAYMKVPAKDKLQWLEDMWQLNQKLANAYPKIAAIQERFRKGTI